MSKLYLEIKSEELGMKQKNLKKCRRIWFNAKIGPGSRNLSRDFRNFPDQFVPLFSGHLVVLVVERDKRLF